MENCPKPYGSPFGPLPLQPKTCFCCFPSSIRLSKAFGVKGWNDQDDEMTPPLLWPWWVKLTKFYVHRSFQK